MSTSDDDKPAAPVVEVRRGRDEENKPCWRVCIRVDAVVYKGPRRYRRSDAMSSAMSDANALCETYGWELRVFSGEKSNA